MGAVCPALNLFLLLLLKSWTLAMQESNVLFIKAIKRLSAIQMCLVTSNKVEHNYDKINTIS